MKILQLSVVVFSLLVNFWTAVRTQTACSPFNGNEASCKGAQCHWCPCTHMCVTKPMKYTCDVGCIGFCGQMAACASHGCIYDDSRGQCYDLAIDTSVDFEKICSTGFCTKKNCEAKGCTVCKKTRTCVPPNMSIGCDPGCVTYCDKPDECTAMGCMFDQATGECQPGIPSRYGLSVNICSNTAKVINGIPYSQTDYSKIRYQNRCYCNPGAVARLPDKEIYECYLTAGAMEIDIPIRDPGPYLMGIHLAEIYGNIGRKQTIRLNGIVAVKEFSFDSVGPAGTPHVAMVKFEVNCNLTEAIIGGTKVSIKDKQLLMHIQVHQRQPGDPIECAINGYYLEKLDF